MLGSVRGGGDGVVREGDAKKGFFRDDFEAVDTTDRGGVPDVSATVLDLAPHVP